jgi:formylglycine-generating enzyme required for sulfatase activity
MRLSCPHCKTLLSVPDDQAGKQTSCPQCRKLMQIPSPPAAAARPRRAGETMTNSMGMTFAWIPPGPFLMGSPEDEPGRKKNERQHHVTLTRGFWMGAHPVTQAQWQTVMGANPSRFQGPTLPVETVGWKDCRTFCEKLEMLDRKPYRMPTEAEWEYACRAGTTTPYFFGTLDPGGPDTLSVYAWYGRGPDKKTHPVGEKKPNPWGLYDTYGNVWEWVADGYGKYPKEPVVDPQGSGAGEYRIVRGGGYSDPAGECRSAARMDFTPNRRIDYIGVRVCYHLD